VTIATRSDIAVLAGVLILVASAVLGVVWLGSWRRERSGRAQEDKTTWQATAGQTVQLAITSTEPLQARWTSDAPRFEVRQGGIEVGRLDGLAPFNEMTASAAAVDGAWRFETRKEGRSWKGVATQAPSGAEVATYRPRKLRDATITLTDKDFVLRASPLKGTWTLRATRHASDVAVLRVKGNRESRSVDTELAPPSLQIDEVALLLLFTIWGVLIESTLPGGEAMEGPGAF
jgi:hypothetical protein